MSENPLVSIIVRTKDRPKLLKRALQSISAQTYRPIEVVLVNDGGCDLDIEEIKTILGDVSLNYINLEKNMGRAHAGNAGIGKAKGKYIGFLDDDDEFYPEHVAVLADYLEQSYLKIAYTDSLMVHKEYDAQVKAMVTTTKVLAFSHDFDYDILLFENYIPFMCLLFERGVLVKAGGLDTNFELYEDHDLLIRLGEDHPFQHIKKITAEYNQWCSATQISQKNSDSDFIKKAYLRLLLKHTGKLVSDKLYNFKSKKDDHIRNLETILKDRDVHICNLETILKDRDVHIGNLETILKDRDVHIGNLETILKDRDVHIGNLETILKDRDVHIGNLESILRNVNESILRDVNIRKLDEIIKVTAGENEILKGEIREKNNIIGNLESELRKEKTTLNGIYNSNGWKALLVYYKLRDKLFPQSSLRRRLIKLFAAIILLPVKYTKSLIKGKGIAATRNQKTTVYDKKFICGIETDLTQPLQVGMGNVLYLSGWCYHTNQEIKKLELLVEGKPHKIPNFRIARPDILAEQCREFDRKGNSLNSGFWVDIPFPASEKQCEVRLSLSALLDNGEKCAQEIGTITLLPSWFRISADQEINAGKTSGEPLIAICMTSHNPNMEFFTRQIDSIIEQTYKNWICIISDDCSRLDIYSKIKEIAGKDPRFSVYRNSSNLGFYHNFERCLSLVPEKAAFIAFSDQDDFWHNDKLAVLISKFDKETTLVYSDMNIVNDRGEPIHNTYWTTRKNNYKNLDFLLFANTVTGAASMIRRELVSYILPFPKKIGESFHDHWLACVALTTGKIGYVDRPLYDYYQHAGNIIGHYTKSNALTFQKIKGMLKKARYGFGSRQFYENAKSLMWRGRNIYFNDVVRLILIANVLKLRCSDIPRHKKGILNQFASLERSVFWLFVQLIKSKLLRRSTLGAEFYCFRGIVLFRLMNFYFRIRKNKYLARYSGLFLIEASSSSVKVNSIGSVDVINQKISHLTLMIENNAKVRINLLIPTIDFKYFFGGYIGKFNFAKMLSEAGYNVRIVIVDFCDYDLPAWKREIRSYVGLEDFFDNIEVFYAFDRTVPLEVSLNDTFIATTWWTAHIAHRAAEEINAGRFIYLIQEYEPFTFTMGTFYALAQQTYRFPHFAIFSTELLRDYFRLNRIGVFREPANGEQNSVSFENAIQEFFINEQEMRERKIKKFLFYARPEQHASRNMFELGVLALSRAIAEGHFDRNLWEFYGMGSVSNIESIKLHQDVCMRLLPKVTLKEYADLLPRYDLGLSLMFTPHPSLPPIEMAAAGLVVVTNTFENKTEERLHDISSNIIAVEPTVDGVKDGLVSAIKKVEDYKARIEGSNVKWSKDWSESFNNEIMSKIKNFFRKDSEEITGD